MDEEADATQKLMDWCQPSSPVEFVIQNCGGKVNALRRYLPHGTPTDLYWQYLAWHEARIADGHPTEVLGSQVLGSQVLGPGSSVLGRSAPASWSTFGVRTRDGMTFCDPVPSQTTHSARLALTCKQICMQSTQVLKRNWSWQMHGGSTCSSNMWTARSIGISGIVRGSLGLTY